MKLKTFTHFAATALISLAIPMALTAQEAQNCNKKHTRYKLIDLGTFGGPQSYVYPAFGDVEITPGNLPLNNQGVLVGQSDTLVSDPNYPNFNPYVGLLAPNAFIQHAFEWHHGVLTDMGALPGLNSSSVEWVNSRGESSGISTDGGIDPLTGWPEAVAVLWENGQIISLGTLGGNESLATAINDQGQVVGMAANGVMESVSFAPLGLPGYGTQQRAFLWQRGVMSDLGTLGGPAAAAFFINERSQVVGMSYSDSNPNPGTGLPTLAPFLWENGTMVNLGSLGGTFGLPIWLNNRGEVVGGSNLAGDATSHPFLWNRGVMKDLGTFGGSNGDAASINDAGEIVGSADLAGDQVHHAALWKNGAIKDIGTVAGDACSRASAINSKGQIVGGSSDCQTFLHAFLWENGGPMIDLNTFVPPGSDLRLTAASTINDRGEIAVNGLLPNGDQHAILLIPCGEGTEGCQDAAEASIPITEIRAAAVTRSQRRLLPNDIAGAWRARLAHRYHIPRVGEHPRSSNSLKLPLLHASQSIAETRRP